MSIPLMHTPVARIVRAIVGFLLVVEAVYEPFAIAAVMVVAGTVVAVLAIADVCIADSIVDALRRQRAPAQEPRERHA